MRQYGRSPRFPKSKREEALSFNAAESFVAAAHDQEASRQRVVKPKREARVPSDDTEAPVLRAVGELLALHPKVLLCLRVNSGSMPYQNAAGRLVPVWFHKILRAPEKVRITDYTGFLTDFRPYAVECKKPSWREPRGERELEQSAYIDLIKRCGGIGAFVTDAEQVNALLA